MSWNIPWSKEGRKIITTVSNQKEKAILVGLDLGRNEDWDLEESLDELAQLTETAEAEVVARVTQKRTAPDPTYYIGQGKVVEISRLLEVTDANVVIFDDELSPTQLHNLEKSLATKVLDRTALILDIFAQRAHSKEGKLQVELAQLRYLLPRLTGKGTALSRLAGGIGTRGPGESKLEMDRRRIRKRIGDLEKEIEAIKKHRTLYRQGRKEIPLPSLALVGYTNAGKSTLLHALTNADVLREDKLFATLDPTTRRLELPNGQIIVLTDTVGFIQKLPHHLVAAFRATLEEVVTADLLLHVIDLSHPKANEQAEAVYKTLTSLNVADKPVITVLNKVDKVRFSGEVNRALHNFPGSVAISALKKQGLDHLLNAICEALKGFTEYVTLKIPYQDSDLIALVHAKGKVFSKKYLDDMVLLEAEIEKVTVQKLSNYRI